MKEGRHRKFWEDWFKKLLSKKNKFWADYTTKLLLRVDTSSPLPAIPGSSPFSSEFVPYNSSYSFSPSSSHFTPTATRSPAIAGISISGIVQNIGQKISSFGSSIAGTIKDTVVNIVGSLRNMVRNLLNLKTLIGLLGVGEEYATVKSVLNTLEEGQSLAGQIGIDIGKLVVDINKLTTETGDSINGMKEDFDRFINGDPELGSIGDGIYNSGQQIILIGNGIADDLEVINQGKLTESELNAKVGDIVRKLNDMGGHMENFGSSLQNLGDRLVNLGDAGNKMLKVGVTLEDTGKDLKKLGDDMFAVSELLKRLTPPPKPEEGGESGTGGEGGTGGESGTGGGTGGGGEKCQTGVIATDSGTAIKVGGTVKGNTFCLTITSHDFEVLGEKFTSMGNVFQKTGSTFKTVGAVLATLDVLGGKCKEGGKKIKDIGSSLSKLNPPGTKSSSSHSPIQIYAPSQLQVKKSISSGKTAPFSTSRSTGRVLMDTGTPGDEEGEDLIDMGTLKDANEYIQTIGALRDAFGKNGENVGLLINKLLSDIRGKFYDMFNGLKQALDELRMELEDLLLEAIQQAILNAIGNIANKFMSLIPPLPQFDAVMTGEKSGELLLDRVHSFSGNIIPVPWTVLNYFNVKYYLPPDAKSINISGIYWVKSRMERRVNTKQCVWHGCDLYMDKPPDPETWTAVFHCEGCWWLGGCNYEVRQNTTPIPKGGGFVRFPEVREIFTDETTVNITPYGKGIIVSKPLDISKEINYTLDPFYVIHIDETPYVLKGHFGLKLEPDVLAGFDIVVPGRAIATYSIRDFPVLHKLYRLNRTGDREEMRRMKVKLDEITKRFILTREFNRVDDKDELLTWMDTSKDWSYVMFNPPVKYYNYNDLFYGGGDIYNWYVTLTCDGCGKAWESKSRSIGLLRNYHEDEPLYWDLASFYMRRRKSKETQVRGGSEAEHMEQVSLDGISYITMNVTYDNSTGFYIVDFVGSGFTYEDGENSYLRIHTPLRYVDIPLVKRKRW